MSCHDGDMSDTLLNAPAGGDPDFSAIPATFSSSANIGGDTAGMTNDHPVGFAYNAALIALDVELNDPATAPVAALLFTGQQMWCSSCHDVHKPGLAANSDVPFLRTTNNASALCLTCHAK
jgi:hypothetical protein